jgi:hypothetical protein
MNLVFLAGSGTMYLLGLGQEIKDSPKGFTTIKDDGTGSE